MVTISIEVVQPGTVLARRVVNEAGIRLFGRGSVAEMKNYAKKHPGSCFKVNRRKS